ncbi:hypothetical protein DFH08DRAFT_804 [Mycena albidolilacea]|uniref:Uncharacterized protein n=1 Tax=Mycena albidolilacea TaxID=1033008 RepID=A0AAD7AT63_9AGAR|nr:hypothetical protein DFH08DRAFT_804 [Mycena albidolilacea]
MRLNKPSSSVCTTLSSLTTFSSFHKCPTRVRFLAETALRQPDRRRHSLPVTQHPRFTLLESSTFVGGGMSTLLIFCLLITNIRSGAAAPTVLNSHDPNYPNTPSNLFLGNTSTSIKSHGSGPSIPPLLVLENNSSIPTDSPGGEKRAMEGPRLKQILLMTLIACLVFYLVFTLTLVVVKRPSCPRLPVGCSIRSASTVVGGYISRVVCPSPQRTRSLIPGFLGPVLARLARPSTHAGPGEGSILPLHHMGPEPPLSPDLGRSPAPSPVLPPRVHNPLEPQHSPSHSTSVFQTQHASQYSLAPSETPTCESTWSDSPTVVRELASRRGHSVYV